MNLLRYQRSNALLYFEAGAAIQKPEREHRFNTDSTTFTNSGFFQVAYAGRTGKPPHSFLSTGVLPARFSAGVEPIPLVLNTMKTLE